MNTMAYNSFDVYDEDDNCKISLETYPDVGADNADAARLKLGNSSYAYVEKYYSVYGDHMMWVGNGRFSCGILFNFSTEEYRIFGTENSSMTSDSTPTP